MVERLYDTLKGILWTEFPKNVDGVPFVYDRKIEQWMFGDRKILPSPLGIIIREPKLSFKDLGFGGLREIEYSIGIALFSSNDDKETSERVVHEAARIAQSILKKHRTLWVCELCPVCEKLPLSPIHYIDNGVITNVGVTTARLPAGQTSYLIAINGNPTGFAATAYIRLTPSISGKLTTVDILSCGLGITNTTYSDAYSSLTLTLSEGSGHAGYAQTVFQNYTSNVINQVYGFWSETHTTGIPQYLEWAGVSLLATQELLSDWRAGCKPFSFTSVSNINDNFDSLISNNSDIARVIQDIQISDISPSDDGVDTALLHIAKFTLKGKEIVSNDEFGPNNVDVNAV